MFALNVEKHSSRFFFTKCKGQINIDQAETVITQEKALTHSWQSYYEYCRVVTHEVTYYDILDLGFLTWCCLHFRIVKGLISMFLQKYHIHELCWRQISKYKISLTKYSHFRITALLLLTMSLSPSNRIRSNRFVKTTDRQTDLHWHDAIIQGIFCYFERKKWIVPLANMSFSFASDFNVMLIRRTIFITLTSSWYNLSHISSYLRYFKSYGGEFFLTKPSSSKFVLIFAQRESTREQQITYDFSKRFVATFNPRKLMFHSLVTAIYPHQLTLTQTNLLTARANFQLPLFSNDECSSSYPAAPRRPRIHSSANPSIYTQSLQPANQTCTQSDHYGKSKCFIETPCLYFWTSIIS